MTKMKILYSKEYQVLLKRLKKARINANLTQIAVAKALKKSQSYVSKIEVGERQLDPMELKSFARLYKVSVSWLTGEK